MECRFQNNGGLHRTSGDAPLETHKLNLGGSGAGLLETPTDLMNADMSVTKRQQISVQQCMRRLKNKIFLSAYPKGDEMTPEEEESETKNSLNIAIATEHSSQP